MKTAAAHRQIGNPKAAARAAKVTCAFCEGTGKDPFDLLSKLSQCPVCSGRGVVVVKMPAVLCVYCLGAGNVTRGWRARAAGGRASCPWPGRPHDALSAAAAGESPRPTWRAVSARGRAWRPAPQPGSRNIGSAGRPGEECSTANTKAPPEAPSSDPCPAPQIGARRKGLARVVWNKDKRQPYARGRPGRTVGQADRCRPRGRFGPAAHASSEPSRPVGRQTRRRGSHAIISL